MSTEENTNLDTATTVNLDDFAAELFGKNETAPVENANPEIKEDVTEVEGDASEQIEDTQPAEATEEISDLEEAEVTDTPTDGEPKKKNRYQERIDELTAARRAAEREAQEAKEELERVKQQQKTTEPTPEPEKVVETGTEPREPSPYDKNEDGSDKYPLGVYDPAYMRDNMQYLFNVQELQRKREEAQIAEQRRLEEARNSLQSSWNAKLVDAQERYPDFREKGEQMLAVFQGIDEVYGQYLTDTLMEMDAGPDVFYYLASNVEEAQKIVNAGPRKATIALAKLEAEIAGTTRKPKATPTNVTKAPEPPPQVKGAGVIRSSQDIVPGDLESFSKVLFSKK